MKLFRRKALAPYDFYKDRVTKITWRSVIRRLPKDRGNPDVPMIAELGSAVRLNSTYLELVDRLYHWRGYTTLFAAIMFGIFFFSTILSSLYRRLVLGMEGTSWYVMVIIWLLVFLPLSIVSLKYLLSEIFQHTYYPIRFNRKTRMVYMHRGNEPVLAVPWDEVEFVLAQDGNKPESAYVIGCVLADDGDTVTHVIPFPALVRVGPEFMEGFWEFVRSYMEEDECVADLAQTISFCSPVEQQKEGWLYGLMFLSRQYTRLGLLYNLPLFPLMFVGSFARWLVMRTSRVPQWPAEVEEACRIAEDDPVNRGPEHNPPQLWKLMWAFEGKKKLEKRLGVEVEAQKRIVGYLREKYGSSQSGQE